MCWGGALVVLGDYELMDFLSPCGAVLWCLGLRFISSTWKMVL